VWKCRCLQTVYLLLHSRVSFSAVVTERSSDHDQMPPTSLRLSKRVTSNPTCRSSFRAASPPGPRKRSISSKSGYECVFDLPPPTTATFILLLSILLFRELNYISEATKLGGTERDVTFYPILPCREFKNHGRRDN
jgi:hypothetical protein